MNRILGPLERQEFSQYTRPKEQFLSSRYLFVLFVRWIGGQSKKLPTKLLDSQEFRLTIFKLFRRERAYAVPLDLYSMEKQRKLQKENIL